MNESKFTWRVRQELEICDNCLYVSANGAPSHDGYASSGHKENYARAMTEYGDEPCNIDEEPSFSRNSCDFCGDTYAGNRYRASVMELHTEQ